MSELHRSSDDVRIDAVPIPAFPGDSGWDDFAAAAEVRNGSETEGYGTTDLNFSAEEALPTWLNQAHDPMRLFVARADGRVVARGVYETLADPAAHFAWFTVQVLPPYRRRGIGTALVDHLESLARTEHRSVHVTYAVSRNAPGERLSSPTGLGRFRCRTPRYSFSCVAVSFSNRSNAAVASCCR
ncbi:GNAT family N-acetyltransferase [Cryobacterium psychrophilum]|uniref:GNAT family N-acetyltransferase n=1 Tax=Cryobacterium psychrophilum TaxID=41988 RepID=A0A4Y8KLS7_9MICO|nr:GNAT family N-acetyltransferase [Cryobacterium psychrophilum]TFD78509.1 GNAT family N-acetyltransferase [Cryobacterium psychrophilum]